MAGTWPAGGVMANATPARRCGACGEYLPHACAPVVRCHRQRFTGRRVLTITDRPRTVDDTAALVAALLVAELGPDSALDYAQATPALAGGARP